MPLGTVLQKELAKAIISVPKTSTADPKVWPPSSERVTWVPLACQATYTVPSERSTATDGSVALDWAFGETCSVKPKMFWARAGGESSELGIRCNEKIQPAKTTTNIRIRSV